MDFFVKEPSRFLAVKLENGLNPGRTSLHIFNQVAVLFNRIFVPVQRTERRRTLFPQHNARVQIKRALFQACISRVIKHHHRSRIFLRLLRIQNLDRIEQVDAVLHFVLGAGKLGIGHFFGKRFRRPQHFPQAAHRSISGILIRCTAREELHVHALCLFQLVRIFQILGVTVLQRIHIVTIRISIEVDHQGIRTGNIIQRIIRHRRFYSQAVGRIMPSSIVFQALFESERFTHLGILFLLEVSLRHAEHNRSKQFRFTLAQGIIGSVGTVPLATVIEIGCAGKIAMVLRN